MRGFIALSCRRSVLAGGLVAALVGGSAVGAEWKIPDVNKLPDDANGKLVREGFALVDQTFAYLGPEAPDASKHYSGNNMACSTCHLDAGTRQFGLSLPGTAEPIADKINLCLTNNMNGKALPKDSPEMNAMVAYIKFLNASVSPAEAAAARDKPMTTPVGNPAAGKEVVKNICVSCHGADGLGKREGVIGDAKGYLVPPLWGKDSWGANAAFTKPGELAMFVHDNMPEGTTHDSPTLTPQEAADAAAYVLTAPRPGK